MILYHIKECGIEKRNREPPTDCCQPGGKLGGPELGREDAGNQGAKVFRRAAKEKVPIEIQEGGRSLQVLEPLFQPSRSLPTHT